ncbi:glycoside hydrolase family 2 TIM barrel-domain containing protein [uncultured Dysgonomonas sp.]|nr:glycoside hydrolase family 2 TIM barrel-domain containing protein [uncultured Dysgonomonas sp.]
MSTNPIEWILGYSFSKEQYPVSFFSAIVPGAVQLDIARAEKYPDYKYADNCKKFRWMEDVYYTYKTVFPRPILDSGRRFWFISKGIDYQFEIQINGETIHEQEGMFSYVEIDLTDYLRVNNTLEILIYPAPKLTGCPDDRTQASHVVKPAVSYGWDWHPRLVPLGIWDETFFEIRNSSYIKDVQIDYELSDSFDQAEITLNVDANVAETSRFEWKLLSADNRVTLSISGSMSELVTERCSLSNPELWWPHDHGTPYLYISEFCLFDDESNLLDQRIQRIGFRQVDLVMNQGAWSEPKEFPKTRSVSPSQIKINGREIFAKGTNWVNPEIFPGIITKEKYNHLLDLVVETNFNIVRSWGGGIINKEPFFDLCDEKGIMVWQEFPLACNEYPDDKHYLAVLKQEATSIIKRLRKHASLVLWCGGNELFNSWSGMTEQSLPLRLLDSLCWQYDRNTPFIMTSPLFGMAHGNYVFRWNGKDIFETINNSKNTAYTEFGIPGASSVDVLKSIITEEELFPPTEGSAWETHHAFNAWDADKNTWLCYNLLIEYMGEITSLAELVEYSQIIQSVGYKAIFEEARRQKPYCSVAMNWCYNEPWPTAANNSLISYPAIPKMALYAVRDSCRPFCVSARISKFIWFEDKDFFAEIWMLNDTFDTFDKHQVIVKLQSQEEEIEILQWTSSDINSNTNLPGPTVRFKLPRWNTIFFKLIVEVVNYPEFSSEYTLLYKKKKTVDKSLTKAMNVTV